RKAAEEGKEWCQLPTSLNWTPVVALSWPRELAEDFLPFAEEYVRWRSGKRMLTTGDDPVVGKFVRARKLSVWATVPSLVEHPDTQRSLVKRRDYNGTNPARRAAGDDAGGSGLAVRPGDALKSGPLRAGRAGPRGQRKSERAPRVVSKSTSRGRTEHGSAVPRGRSGGHRWHGSQRDPGADRPAQRSIRGNRLGGGLRGHGGPARLQRAHGAGEGRSRDAQGTDRGTGGEVLRGRAVRGRAGRSRSRRRRGRQGRGRGRGGLGGGRRGGSRGGRRGGRGSGRR